MTWISFVNGLQTWEAEADWCLSVLSDEAGQDQMGFGLAYHILNSHLICHPV